MGVFFRNCSYKLLLSGVVMAALGSHAANAEVGEAGTLTATTACEAYSSKNTKANPGNVLLEVGKAYKVSGRNATGGEWLHISVDGVETPRRWVNQSCGTLVAQAQEPASAPASGEQKAADAKPAGQKPAEPQKEPKSAADEAKKPDAPKPTFAPFFDSVAQAPVDDTPAVPTLSAFDAAILTICGPWDSTPQAKDFESALLTVFPEQLSAIQKAVGGGLTTPNAPTATFAQELTAAWFDNKAFKHVFCGEPNKKSLGGLHFEGRYLQAQRAGWAGRLDGPQCDKGEVKAPVYSVGVSFLTPDGGAEKACPKSYVHGEGALDILIHGTQALKAARNWAKPEDKSACVANISTTQGDYAALLVIKKQAVVTFYPVASPSTKERSCQ